MKFQGRGCRVEKKKKTLGQAIELVEDKGMEEC
jgi:hypothetical protein